MRTPNNPSDYALALLWPCLGFWIFTIIYYHVGLTINPNLSAETYLTILSYVTLIFLGYKAGARNSKIGPAVATRTSRPEWYLVPSLIGHALLLLDKYISGVTLTVVATQTELLRDSFNTSTLTTYAVPLCCLLYPGIAKWLSSLRLKPSLKSVPSLLVVANIATILGLAVFSGNRAAFAQIILLATFLVFYIIPVFRSNNRGPKNAMALHKLRRNVLWGIAMLGATAATYFVFVSTYRISEQFLTSQVGSVETRVDLADFVSNPRTELGILMLSSYFTQQFGNVQEIVKSSRILDFDASPFFFWFLRQIDRLGTDLYDPSVEYYRMLLVQRGLSEYGWPSMFGHATLYYGWLGGPPLLGILAYAFGSIHKAFLATLSETSLLAVYALFCFFSYSYMAIPSDHYLAGSLITLAAWKIKALVLSSNKS